MPRKRNAEAASTNLAKNVRALRETRGWSQAELAEKAGGGMHVTSVSRLETGAVTPSLDVVTVLSEIFGVPLDALVHNKPTLEQTPEESEKAGLHRLVDQLRPEFYDDARLILTALALGRHALNIEFGEHPRIPRVVHLPDEKPEDGT